MDDEHDVEDAAALASSVLDEVDALQPEAGADADEQLVAAETAEVVELTDIADLPELADLPEIAELSEAAELSETAELSEAAELSEIAELAEPASPVEAAELVEAAQAVEPAELALAEDAAEEPGTKEATEVAAAESALDEVEFEFDLSEEEPEAAQAASEVPEAFEFKVAPVSAPSVAQSEPALELETFEFIPSDNDDGFDFGSLSFDEDDAKAADAKESVYTPRTNIDECDTKIDLAVAYEAMGDVDGAIEILDEVIAEGKPAQIEEAQQLKAKWQNA
jgi:FimV-like protein